MLDGMEKIKIVTYDYFLNNEGRLISRFLFKIDELYLKNLLYTKDKILFVFTSEFYSTFSLFIGN